MDNEVYLVKCDDYNEAKEKISELFEMMGRIDQFVKFGEKIVLKPNLLSAAEPEKAVSTNPAVVAAVGKLFKAREASIVLADSPGAGYAYNEKKLKQTYQKCDMDKAADEGGFELNFDTTHEIVSYPEGDLIKRFEIITPILKADGVINLCKLKTHTFMAMSGAVKNNFGVIPGLTKPGYHAKFQDTSLFARMLLDLASYVSPRLSIMDAVVGMEGDGPHSGTPRKVGLIMASTNQLALDTVAGEIMGLPRTDNLVLMEAEKRGLKPNSIDDVEIIGIEKKELRVSGYKLPSTLSNGAGLEMIPSLLRQPIASLLKHGASLKPSIIKDKCTACGACRDACPMHVITINDNRYAQIDDRDCIRCYCCHEMCSFEAIELKSSWLYHFLNKS